MYLVESTLIPRFLDDDTEIRETAQSHTVSDGVRTLYLKKKFKKNYPNF